MSVTKTKQRAAFPSRPRGAHGREGRRPADDPALGVDHREGPLVGFSHRRLPAHLGRDVVRLRQQNGTMDPIQARRTVNYPAVSTR
jgi:hypothetical protein